MLQVSLSLIIINTHRYMIQLLNCYSINSILNNKTSILEITRIYVFQIEIHFCDSDVSLRIIFPVVVRLLVIMLIIFNCVEEI